MKKTWGAVALFLGAYLVVNKIANKDKIPAIDYLIAPVSAANGQTPTGQGSNSIALPQHPTKKFNQGTLSRLTQVVIYQSGSETETVQEIAQDHIIFGSSPTIRFHEYIERNGDLVHCNPYTSIIPDFKDSNSYSLNVALAGDFDKQAPTAAQLQTLNKLLAVEIRKEVVQNLTVIGYQGSTREYLGATLYNAIAAIQLPKDYSLSVLY
ncbi:MAG: peptidoglycan recognition protein family protein [Aureispira sp.]